MRLEISPNPALVFCLLMCALGQLCHCLTPRVQPDEKAESSSPRPSCKATARLHGSVTAFSVPDSSNLSQLPLSPTAAPSLQTLLLLVHRDSRSGSLRPRLVRIVLCVAVSCRYWAISPAPQDSAVSLSRTQSVVVMLVPAQGPPCAFPTSVL